MEIEKIKILLKNHNHILIDYTDKFINSDDEIQLGNNKYMSKASKIYLEVFEKTKEDKYKNVVFLLDISRLVKYNNTFYNLLIMNEEIVKNNTNLYLIKNCNNNFVFPIGDFENYKKVFTDVIINQKNDIYICNVCYNEKKSWIEIEHCKICNYRTCIKCIIKAGNLNKKCFHCRNETKDKYNVLYDLLSLLE